MALKRAEIPQGEERTRQRREVSVHNTPSTRSFTLWSRSHGGGGLAAAVLWLSVHHQQERCFHTNTGEGVVLEKTDTSRSARQPTPSTPPPACVPLISVLQWRKLNQQRTQLETEHQQYNKNMTVPLSKKVNCLHCLRKGNHQLSENLPFSF